MKLTAKKILFAVVSVVMFCCFFSGCEMLGFDGEPPVQGGMSSSSGGSGKGYPTYEEAAAGSPVTLLMMPEASGVTVWNSDSGDCSIDVSNIEDGYFMANYTGEQTGNSTDIKVTVVTSQHRADNQEQYRYNLRQDGEYEAFPLSDGDDYYLIQVNKRTDGNRYAILLSVEIDVVLEDEFGPFLVPSQYVNYDKNSTALKFAREISGEATSPLEKVDAVYAYITKNIDYDTEFAEHVLTQDPYGYLPDIDETLRTGKGICFDYSAITAAMLRSMGIPAKMVHGWAGTVYHAWIMVYTEDTGWIGVIEFNGSDWIRMDPTFASSGDSQQLRDFIGDGSNYSDSYWY